MQNLSPLARGLKSKIGQRYLVCKHRYIEGPLTTFTQIVSLALAWFVRNLSCRQIYSSSECLGSWSNCHYPYPDFKVCTKHKLPHIVGDILGMLCARQGPRVCVLCFPSCFLSPPPFSFQVINLCGFHL